MWLPEGYDSRRRYPVLYMQDGQNLFDQQSAGYGMAWEIDSVFTHLIRTGELRSCIVVGIWNTSLRFREYTPARPYALQLFGERP